MLGSKLTVSEETRVYADLNKTEKARMRIERLKEADLSSAMTRKDVAVLGGYEYGDTKGTSWVSNLVNRGFLSETFYTTEGKVRLFRYRLTGKEVGRRKHKRKRKVTTPAVLSASYAPIEKTPTEKTRVVIEHNGMTVTIENANANFIGEIIKTIK